MTLEQIKEGNKLIAEFMGYQILHKKYEYLNFNSSNESYWDITEGDIVCDENGNEVDALDNYPFYSLEDLPFHSSWDWLMPVVSKCSKTKGFYDTKFQTYCKGALFFEDLDLYSPIDDIYKAVVEFIKWYNENNN